MTRYVHAIAILFSLHGLGCLVGDAEDDDSVDTSNVEFEAPGNPKNINIGFDGGASQFGVDQFAFYPVFYRTGIHQAPRLCHTYVKYDVANEAAGMGNSSSPGGKRAAFEYYLAHAQLEGGCQEVLVSFQAQDVQDVNGQIVPKPGATCSDGSTPPCDPPSAGEVRAAWKNFLETDWRGETGYTGAFAFTPWNEPNNAHGAGNGLGNVIPPETAAHYYLILAELCASHGGCKVAAGDFASNGNWPADFEWNCANDNIKNLTTTHQNGDKFCRHASSLNPNNKRHASYLDRYKNYLALNWQGYTGVSDRPDFFAYHGWADANDYLNQGSHCSDYETCVTRKLLKSLSGSWSGVKIWDTEVGASQGADISNPDQACDAAFLMRLTSLNARIDRLYYTRLYNGGGDSGGELVHGSNPMTAVGRPALAVLANRETSFPAGNCR